MQTKDKVPGGILLACLSLLFSGVMLPETIGFLRGDYTSAANFISELGAVGAEYASIINLIAFPVVGISVLVIIAYLWRRLSGATLARVGLIGIAIGIPVGYFIAAIFPCDYGCPIEGTSRQAIHNYAGLVEYTIGSIGFILLALGLRGLVSIRTQAATFAVGAIMITSFVMMLMPEQASVRGVWQRLADYGAFLLLMALTFRLSGWQTRAETRKSD